MLSEVTLEQGENKMPSFLKDISKFYGTGEKNSAGQTLEEFLEEYDPYKYKTPCCTTDAVIFSFDGERCENEEELKVLLVRRSNHPSIGCLALPGGFINLEENLEDTARRELEEETGVKGLVMEQLAVYGDYDGVRGGKRLCNQAMVSRYAVCNIPDVHGVADSFGPLELSCRHIYRFARGAVLRVFKRFPERRLRRIHNLRRRQFFFAFKLVYL